jgi:hypothetical protein
MYGLNVLFVKNLTKNDSIIDIYGCTEIFVRHGTRFFSAHLDGSFLKEECIEQIEAYKNKTDFTIEELEQIFKSMAKQLRNNTLFRKFGDFKNIEKEIDLQNSIEQND